MNNVAIKRKMRGSFHVHFTGRRVALGALLRAARAMMLESYTARVAQEPVLITTNFTNPFWHVTNLMLIEYIGFVR